MIRNSFESRPRVLSNEPCFISQFRLDPEITLLAYTGINFYAVYASKKGPEKRKLMDFPLKKSMLSFLHFQISLGLSPRNITFFSRSEA